jgi:hypothetical protein
LEKLKEWGRVVGELAARFVAFVMTIQGGGLQGLIDQVFGAGTLERVQGFASSFQPIIDAVKNLFSAFQSSGPTIREEIGNIGSTLSSIFGTQGPQIIENFAGIIQTLADYWNKYGNDIIQFTSQMIQVISVFLVGGLQLISGLINGILKIIMGDWQGAWDAIKKSTEVFADGIMRLMGTTLQDVRKTWENNLNMLVQIVVLLYGKMVEAGGRIVQGLKTGISNQWNALVSWLRSKIAELVKMVQDALKIKSPSGVFENIGAQMMAGMAEGIRGAVSMPQLALARANAGMTGAAGGAAGATINANITIVPMPWHDEDAIAAKVLYKLQTGMNFYRAGGAIQGA